MRTTFKLSLIMYNCILYFLKYSFLLSSPLIFVVKTIVAQ